MSHPALKPFAIGPHVIDPPLILAPMAGVTHSPFRQLVASFGRPGLFFSEMLSAKSLVKENLEESIFLKRSPLERPMAYQIFAADPAGALTGCQRLLQTNAEIIDFNLCCPAPEIAKRRKAGAHLLTDLDLTAQVLSALRQAMDRPLTVKIRLGRKPDRSFLRDLAALFESCGVAAVTLHPRLTTEKLKRRARWEYIGFLKSVTRLPVIGNGDVTGPADCFKMFDQTGCDGVMIGRAAVQKPWLFGEICGRPLAPTPAVLQGIYQHACAMIIDFFPPTRALGRIKEFTWYFSRNLQFGHHFSARIQNLPSCRECLTFAREEFLHAC